MFVVKTMSRYLTACSPKEVKAKIVHLNERLFENHRHFNDNKFRTLTYAKLGLGIATAYAGMSLGGGLTNTAALLGSIWVYMVFARNVLVDAKACKPARDDQWLKSCLTSKTDMIRRRKLSNDMFISGLSSIPVVGAKLFISDEVAQALNAGTAFHIAMDIACVSLVGGSLNYLQRICRGYSAKVAGMDALRSFVMSAGAYLIFGLLYGGGFTDRLIFSAEKFAIMRKTIGEIWAARVEFPDVKSAYMNGGKTGKLSSKIGRGE